MATLTAPPVPRPPLARQARLWVTVLWAATLAAGAAALDWGDRQIGLEAARERLVLLPANELDPAARVDWARKLAGDPAVAAARWLSPAELVAQTARRFPQSTWQGLFPADEAWLPWMLEIVPREPLSRLESLRAFAAAREAEADWRLVLWDPLALRRLAHERRLLWTFGLLALGLAGLTGIMALSCLAWPPGVRPVVAALAAALVSLGATAAVWGGTLLAADGAGGGADGRSLAIGLAAAFLLAAIMAPMIQKRTQSTLSVKISEAQDERKISDQR